MIGSGAGPDAIGQGSSSRDRDGAGRAHNARPRDAAGRPLPRGAAGVTQAPEDLVLPPPEALAEAQRLLDAGRPFPAHEVLEGAWKAAPAHERHLWQGLAQLAVGLTHLQRGNAAGALALLRRGAERIRPYAGTAPYRIDVTGLATYAELLAAAVARTGLPGAPVAAPRLRVPDAGRGRPAPSLRSSDPPREESRMSLQQPVTDNSIKVRQLSHYQFSWVAGEPGQPGAWTLQLVLDQGAWEEVLTLSPDDADVLDDMLARQTDVHYDVERRVLMFGTTPVGA